MTRAAVLLAVILGALIPRVAFAWGDKGHELVALIAQRRLEELNRQARGRMDAVLSHLKWDDLEHGPRTEADDIQRQFSDNPSFRCEIGAERSG